MARKSLGRGLSTLLGENSKPVQRPTQSTQPVGVPETKTTTQSGRPLEVDVNLISPNPYQPRTEFDSEALEELAESLSTHGMLEPLLVRKDPENPSRYQLIAGERRHRASQLAEFDRVPILLKTANDQEMLEIAIVENVQRENLNPIEEAKGYQRLLDASAEFGEPLTQQQVATKVGKNRSVIANLLRLLDLPKYVQESIQKGELSQGHGKVFAGLDPPLIKAAWKKAVKSQLSVRALERNIRALQKETEQAADPSISSPTVEAQKDPNLVALEEALRERLRTKVKFVQKKDRSGYLMIEFFNSEDLDRLLESLDIEM